MARLGCHYLLRFLKTHPYIKTDCYILVRKQYKTYVEIFKCGYRWSMCGYTITWEYDLLLRHNIISYYYDNIYFNYYDQHANYIVYREDSGIYLDLNTDFNDFGLSEGATTYYHAEWNKYRLLPFNESIPLVYNLVCELYDNYRYGYSFMHSNP